MSLISYANFKKVDIRIGTIIEVKNFIQVRKLAGLLFLSCLTIAKLYSAAVPDPVVISREDKAAFTAIMQMFAIAEKYQDNCKQGIDFYSNTTNPAQILSTSHSRAVCNGISKTGLYITADSQYVGSPFGIIRLYCWNSYIVESGRIFSNTLKTKFKIERLDDKISIFSPEGCYDFHGRTYKILKVRNSELPPLELPAPVESPLGWEPALLDRVCGSDIDLARRKWCALTKEYAVVSAKVAAKIHDKRAIELAARAAVVDGWAKQSEASLAKLNKERA